MNGAICITSCPRAKGFTPAHPTHSERGTSPPGCVWLMYSKGYKQGAGRRGEKAKTVSAKQGGACCLELCFFNV